MNDIAKITIELDDQTISIVGAIDIEAWDDQEHGVSGMTWEGGTAFVEEVLSGMAEADCE